MTGDETKLEMYRLFLGTAERVSDRRATANQWLLSVNGAIVSFYGLLSSEAVGSGSREAEVWTWAIPVAGMIVCLTWVSLINSYQKLNSAKFLVLQEIERDLPYQPFDREQEHYRKKRRGSLSRIERGIPWSFAALFLVLLLHSIVA
jgi:hypothetical protein